MSKANPFIFNLKSVVIFWCCVIFFSCTYHDVNDNSPNVVLKKAAEKCGQSAGDMQWLKSLLVKAETDFSLKGNIYAVRLNERIIFIHQPFIMSCMACVLYDCNGSRIEPATVDIQKLAGLMSRSTMIYEAYLD